jgi:hypothetical protein
LAWEGLVPPWEGIAFPTRFDCDCEGETDCDCDCDLMTNLWGGVKPPPTAGIYYFTTVGGDFSLPLSSCFDCEGEGRDRRGLPLPNLKTAWFKFALHSRIP